MTDLDREAAFPPGGNGASGRRASPIDPEASPSRRPHLTAVAGVALGAALGATARFAAFEALPSGPLAFPTATFGVNVAGSFLLGVLMGALPRWRASPQVRSVVASGVIGTFTTFSTFMVDTVLLLRGNRWDLAALYVGASLAGGLAAAWLGVRAGRMGGRVSGRREEEPA